MSYNRINKLNTVNVLNNINMICDTSNGISKKVSYDVLLKKIICDIYPIGCIFISIDNNLPFENIISWEKQEGGVLWSSDTGGAKNRESMPTIYNSIDINTTTNSFSHVHYYNRTLTESNTVCLKHGDGSIYNTSGSLYACSTDSSGAHSHNYTATINLLVLSEEYKNGNKVQPRAYIVNVYKRVK